MFFLVGEVRGWMDKGGVLGSKNASRFFFCYRFFLIVAFFLVKISFFFLRLLLFFLDGKEKENFYLEGNIVFEIIFFKFKLDLVRKSERRRGGVLNDGGEDGEFAGREIG